MEHLRELIHSLPPWLNIKVMGAVVLIGIGAWVFFKSLGELSKLAIAVALIGLGIFIIAKVMRMI